MTRSAASGSRWLLVRPAIATPRVRLLCVPNAGAGMLTFREWPKALPNVELALAHLPARDGRMEEAPATSIAHIADALAEAIVALPPLPVACFGHSMGALIAFETSHRLARFSQPVTALVVSGRRAPSQPLRGEALDLTAPDAEFLRELDRRYGGVPAAIWEDEDLQSMWLPVIRADLTMVHRYARGSEPPLACPIWAYGGRDDAQTSDADLAAWQTETRADCGVRWFTGGHFFIENDRAAVLRALAADLETASARAARS